MKYLILILLLQVPSAMADKFEDGGKIAFIHGYCTATWEMASLASKKKGDKKVTAFFKEIIERSAKRMNTTPQKLGLTCEDAVKEFKKTYKFLNDKK